MKTILLYLHTTHYESTLVRVSCFAWRTGALYSCFMSFLNGPFCNSVCRRFKSVLRSPSSKLSVGFSIQFQNKVQGAFAFTRNIGRGRLHQFFYQLRLGRRNYPGFLHPVVHRTLFNKELLC
nr:MAG TPA: hypothetical protein [Caudoviricetes sp.]